MCVCVLCKLFCLFYNLGHAVEPYPIPIFCIQVSHNASCFVVGSYEQLILMYR